MNKASAMVVLVLWLSVLSWGQATPDSSAPQAQAPAAPAGRRAMGVSGTITAISGGDLTLKTPDGRTFQVNISDKTQYRKDHDPAKLEDFKIGDSVFVRGEPGAGENTWQAEVVMSRAGSGHGEGMGEGRGEGLGKRFIRGEIKAINGTQLTILRPDGVTQTIAVDESTSFRKEKQSITLGDLKPGDHVFGRGEMKNDVFVPTVLNFGEPRSMTPQGQQSPPQN